ncbi:MAG: pitrilysin family protein [Planctomycetota bacterium]
MGHITHSKLASGLDLLVEPMVGVRSAAITISVPAGLVSEPADRLGAAGVMSEVLMRGAGELDSRAAADAFDRAGCTRHVDAGSRGMVLRGVTIGDAIGGAIGLFAKMLLGPSLTDDAVAPSKLLARQALDSLEDDPRERASIAARARHLPPPFNRSALGDRAGIEALTTDDLRAWWAATALPGGTIIGVAGDVDAERVVDAVSEALDGWAGDWEEPSPVGAAPRGVDHIEDDSNQVQILTMHEAPIEADEPASIREKLAASVLSGGMSGRLFTEVREKRGLCYAVSAGYRGDDRFGSLSAYVGTTPERAQESLDVLNSELRRIRTPEGAVTEAEFERARTGMRANVVFHGESTSARSGALVSDFRKVGRGRTLDEMTALIDSVTLGSLNEYLVSTPLGGATLQTLGPSSLEAPPGF